MLKSFLKSFASHSWRIGSISWPKRPALTLWGQTSFLLLLSFSRQIQKAITMLLYPNNINLLSYNFNVISTMHFYLINQKVFWGGGGMSYFFRPLYQFCNAQKHGDILYCSSWQPIYNSLFGSTLVGNLPRLESSMVVMRSCTPVLLALFLPARK